MNLTVATLFTEFHEEPENEERNSDFYAWVCDLLDLFVDKNNLKTLYGLHEPHLPLK